MDFTDVQSRIASIEHDPRGYIRIDMNSIISDSNRAFNALVGEDAKGKHLGKYIASGQGHPHDECMEKYFDIEARMAELGAVKIKPVKGKNFNVVVQRFMAEMNGQKVMWGFVWKAK